MRAPPAAPKAVLAVLLALVLLVQTGWAAAHCLAMAAPAGHATEICTPDGIRTIRVAEDGTALADAPNDHGAGFCATCPLPVAAAPEAPGAVAAGVTWVPAPAPVAAATPAPRARARAPPYAPRGPPTLA